MKLIDIFKERGYNVSKVEEVLNMDIKELGLIRKEDLELAEKQLEKLNEVLGYESNYEEDIYTMEDGELIE